MRMFSRNLIESIRFRIAIFLWCLGDWFSGGEFWIFDEDGGGDAAGCPLGDPKCPHFGGAACKATRSHEVIEGPKLPGWLERLGKAAPAYYQSPTSGIHFPVVDASRPTTDECPSLAVWESEGGAVPFVEKPILKPGQSPPKLTIFNPALTPLL